MADFRVANMDTSDRVVIAPHYGEFGWMVLHHLRYVHYHPAKKKIALIERGRECLYPSATLTIPYDHPVADDLRWNGTVWGDTSVVDQHRKKLLDAATVLFPDCKVVEPIFDCPWHMSDGVKFRPVARAVLPKVDVVLGVRKRGFVPERNFHHWPEVIASLKAQGLTVGICGRADLSFDVDGVDAKAWDHLDGDTAGTVDLLNNCGLYVGMDSGMSHLAALMDVPMLVWRIDYPGCGSMLGLMQRANKGYFRQLPDNCAVDVLIREIPLALRACKTLMRHPIQVQGTFHSQFGEDKWVAENVALPDRGVFVEVGANDGEYCSTTLHFERKGWTGLLIEPDPRQHQKLRDTRTATIEACAIGRGDEGEIHLHDHGPWSGFLAGGQAVKVPIKSLTQALDDAEIKQVDYLTIDTEGTELDVWRSLDVERFKPTVVVVEYITPGLPERSAEVEAAMTAKAYRLVRRTEANLVFVRESK